MADKKISELSAAAALTGGELVPIVQSGVTVRTTAQGIADLATLAAVAPQDITYSALKALYDAGTLVPLQWYRITDFETIYDQTISGVTKTAAGEVLLVQATSASTLSNVAKSESFPDDIIHYDITVDTTFINAAAAKGKITYREDKAGNKAYFDWRKVLQYNPNDASEALLYDLTKPLVSANEVSTSPEIGGFFASVEFPSVQLKGNAYLNSNNLLALFFVNGDFTQNSNNFITSTSVGGTVSQNINLDVTDCNVTGNVNYCQTGSWTESTFGENVNKVVTTNFYQTTIGDRLDRITNSAFLNDTVSGRLYWCNSIFMQGSTITGHFSGVNNISWVNTNSNCYVENISGITHQSEDYGFNGCTITGTSGSDFFGNLTIETKVTGKTIDQASYPELFDTTLHKTIYAKPNGDIWYRWLDNSNVWQFTQIV